VQWVRRGATLGPQGEPDRVNGEFERYVTSAGRVRWVRRRGQPINVAHDVVTGLNNAAQNITAQNGTGGTNAVQNVAAQNVAVPNVDARNRAWWNVAV